MNVTIIAAFNVYDTPFAFTGLTPEDVETSGFFL